MAIATPVVRFHEPQIEMAHGAGGKASRRLVEGLFAPLFFAPAVLPFGAVEQVEEQFRGTLLMDLLTHSSPSVPLGILRGESGAKCGCRWPAEPEEILNPKS